MSFHICTARSQDFRRVLDCPTCKRRRRFIVTTTIWHGVTFTCCGCGDSWGEGERMERPFRRAWRAEATESARRRWADAWSPKRLPEWLELVSNEMEQAS